MKHISQGRMRETFLLVVLTAFYLVCELGFNARLLDVVGGAATPSQVESIEKYGRILSGLAVALVVLQLGLLYRRKRIEENKKPLGLIGILLACLLTAAGVYTGIRALVDHFVETSSPEFRRTALNLVLIQRALIDEKVELGALEGGKESLTKPEGKAFLAIFPFMAQSVSRLDEKIQSGKREILESEIDRQFGGAQSFYKGPYTKALTETGSQWKKYANGPADIESEIRKQQDRAWQDYVTSLRKHGWSPTTVPSRARSKVVAQTRRKVPVPSNWNPDDEETFRIAVEKKTRAAWKGRDASGAVIYKGYKIPPGLDFDQFVLQPPIQRELKERLKLPGNVTVKSRYASGADFEMAIYRPMVKARVVSELPKYDAPASQYADGEKHAQEGISAARSALVPPIALLFSLIGAIGHTAKLLYLLIKYFSYGLGALGGNVLAGLTARMAFPVLVLTMLGGWVTLSKLDNSVTTSHVYQYMIAQMGQTSTIASIKEKAVAAALPNIMHVVTVGQGFGYPINERIRKEWLQGFDYGYSPATH